MTTPAIKPGLGLRTEYIETTYGASLGASPTAEVGFYGAATKPRQSATTVPTLNGFPDLVALATPDAADLPTAIALVNALKADRNGSVREVVNLNKSCVNNAATSLGEVRIALGEVGGIGLLDITP